MWNVAENGGVECGIWCGTVMWNVVENVGVEYGVEW